MSSGKRTALVGALLALAIVSGPAFAKSKYKMTPEEEQLYNLQLQQGQEEAAKWAAAHPAEARALWDQNARSIEENDRNFEAIKRHPPKRPEPDPQQMCSRNYGDTIGLVPCGT